MGVANFGFPDGSDQDVWFQSQVGRALAVASRFESNCRSLQSFDSGRNPEKQAPPGASDEERFAAMAKQLTAVLKKTLNAHAGEIAERYAPILEIPFEEVLIAAVKARNTIAHELASGLAEGRSAHSEWVVYQAVRLRETVEQVALGDRLVAYILSVEFPGEPQPTQDQIENYARRAADWVLLGRCAKFY